MPQLITNNKMFEITEMFMIGLAKDMRLIRLSCGLTLEDASYAVDIEKGKMSYYENNKQRMTMKTYLKIIYGYQSYCMENNVAIPDILCFHYNFIMRMCDTN